MSSDLKMLQLDHGRFCWRESGEGRPLVLLHGWSMSHAVFSELADLLSADYRLLIPDLPGHGESATVDPCDLKSFSQLLAVWLDNLGLDQVDLLGWSLGGQVALQFCADYQLRVRRLILLSSTPRFCIGDTWSAGLSQTKLRTLRRGLQMRYLATMGEFFDLQFEGEDLSSDRRREILRFAVRPAGLPEPENAISTLKILGQEDLRSLLDLIEHDSLIVHGENDQIIPLTAGEYLSEKLQHGQLVSLPSVGHAPFLSCPTLLVQLIKEFCR